MKITSFLNSQKLPLFVEPADNLQSNADFRLLKETLLRRRDCFREKLLTHGAILRRGYSVSSIEELESLVACFSEKEFFNYAGGASPRRSLSGGVYNSTEYPAHFGLRLHNELSYSENFPHHLYFCCLTAPEKGGETTLGDSRRILRKINPTSFGARANAVFGSAKNCVGNDLSCKAVKRKKAKVKSRNTRSIGNSYYLKVLAWLKCRVILSFG